MSWTRGARPRGNLLYGQTWLETPDPVRSPKLSNHGRVQYSGGGPPGKRTYCTVSHHISVLPTSEVRTSESPGGGGIGLGLIPASPSLLCKGSTVELVFCLRNLARTWPNSRVLWSWCSALGTRRLEGEVGDPHTWTWWRTALRAGSGSALQQVRFLCGLSFSSLSKYELRRLSVLCVCGCPQNILSTTYLYI